MRNVSREWKAAMSARGVESRRLVSIYTNQGPREFVTGGKGLFGAQPSVQSVSAHSASVDPWTCAVSIGERTVKLVRDLAVRELVSRHHMAGRRLEVRLGAVGLERRHWVLEWVGQILDAPSDGDNGVSIRAGDASSFLRDRQIVGAWIARHPLSIIVEIFDLCEVPQDLWDRASFNERQFPTISHLSVSRAAADNLSQDPTAVTSPINAWTAVNELLQLVNGAVTFDGRGRMVFQRFDPRAAGVRHWTKSQHSGFRMLSAAANRCDQLSVEFLKGGTGTRLNEPAVYTARDRTAPNEHLFHGHSPRHKDSKLSSDWLNGIAFTGVDIDAADVEIDLIDAEKNGFCGLRFRNFGQPQHPEDAVSTGRPAYIRVENEIMSIAYIVSVSGRSLPLGPSPGQPYNLVTRVRVGRGLFGTAVVDHPWPQAGNIQDVTIPILITQDRARFLHGAPTVELRVPISEFDVQLFELISFDEERCLFYGVDGATVSEKWAVLGQAVDESSSTPSVLVTLGFVYSKTPTDTSELEPVPRTPVITDSRFRQAAEERVTDIIFDGMLVAATSGLEVEIARGGVTGTGMGRDNPDPRRVTLPASRDCYLRYSFLSHTIAIEDVPNNDPEPALRRGFARMARVVTGVAAVTGITNQHQTRPLNGARLRDGTVQRVGLSLPLDGELSLIRNPAGAARHALDARAAQTNDATVTTAIDVRLEDDTAGLIEVHVAAKRSGSSASAVWLIRARVRCQAGAAVVVASSTDYTSNDDVWSVAVDASGADIRVRVTGAAGQTVDWTTAALLTLAQN